MAHEHDHEGEDHTALHHHDCGNLFGCGDEKGTGIIRDGELTDRRSEKRN